MLRLERQLDTFERETSSCSRRQSVRAVPTTRRSSNSVDRPPTDLDQARQRLAEVNQEIDVSRKVYREALRDSEPVDLAEWDRRIRELERRRNTCLPR